MLVSLWQKLWQSEPHSIGACLPSETSGERKYFTVDHRRDARRHSHLSLRKPHGGQRKELGISCCSLMNAFRKVVNGQESTQRVPGQEKGPGDRVELWTTHRAQGNCHFLRGSTAMGRNWGESEYHSPGDRHTLHQGKSPEEQMNGDQARRSGLIAPLSDQSPEITSACPVAHP